jgi:hypothetical protein
MNDSNQQAIFWGGVIISFAIGLLTRAEFGWISFGVMLVLSGLISHFYGNKEEEE